MIKAEELRIGNWVLTRGGKMELGNVYPVQLERTNRQNLHLYNPILITEEILLKSGFVERDTIQGSIFFSRMQPDFELETFEGAFSFIWDGAYTGRHIKFVHELQNLFYALINEELQINL